jgi:tripartite-type tricarboxylate transporter receptor subunit TctC
MLAAVGGAMLSLPGTGAAQAGFPSKPVRILIPFAPGQGSDVLARALSDKLTAMWSQPVIVENRAGANGSLAAQEVAKAPGDGHTLLLTSNSPMVINPSLYKKLPYDARADFRPVILLATTELALVVSPSLGVKTVADLVAYAQANPGKLSYASPGAGSTSHLAMEAFRRVTKTSMVHIPYKGSAPAMADIMGGSVHLMMDAFPSSVPHVRGGRVLALAVTGKQQSGYLPGVPTLAEAGVQGMPGGAWYGVFAPAGVDQAVADRMNADFASVLKQPEFAPRFRSLYLESAPAMTAAQFGQMVAADAAQWESTTRALGMFRTE